MSRHLTLFSAVAVLAILVTAGGCVSRAEYDKLLAANRNAQAQLDKALETAQQLRQANQAMTADLAAKDAAVAAGQKEVQLLESANAELKKKFDEIYALYRQAVDRGELPMPGAINILPEKVDRALRDFAQANPDLVDYLSDYGMLKLKADLTFEPGSDFVQPNAAEALGKFVEIVNSPEAAKFNIYIAGHTDDMPISKPATRRRHPDNWYLSVHRGVAVQQALTKAGLGQQRIGVMGFGEHHPIAPNQAGNKGNKLNRRVEIWIVPPDRFLTQAVQAAPAEAGK